MESILIRNLTAIVTQDNRRTVLTDADLMIEGKRVAAMGEDLPASADLVLDGTGMVAIPGLINTHTHIPMVLLRGVADDMKLKEWLEEKVWPIEAHLNADSVRAGALLGMLESLRMGTTTIADMYFFEDAIAEAAVEIGIRGILASSYMDFGTPDEGGVGQIPQRTKDFVGKWKGRSDLVTPSVGPHAPYSCSPELLRETAEFAGEKDVIVQIHLAEDRSEVEDIKKRYGTTPIEHVAGTGLFSAKVMAAHVVWPSDDEIGILAKSGALVSHNPVSNLKTAAGVSPVQKMISSGVSVGLGTDGAASNNTLDMFETMKVTALVHKKVSRDPTAMNSQQVLDLATIVPVECLGLETGSIEEGKLADVVLLSIKLPWWTPLHSIVSHLVYAARSTDVDTVIVNGRIVVQEGELKSMDQEDIMANAAESAKNLLEKAGVPSLITRR